MKNFEEAKKEYNRIVMDIGCEFLSIGTSFTEFPEEKEQWTIRDMVSEIKYQLDCCYEEGNANADGKSIRYLMDAYGMDREDARADHEEWLKKTRRLRAFINKYKKDALESDCFMNHCSEYDIERKAAAETAAEAAEAAAEAEAPAAEENATEAEKTAAEWAAESDRVHAATLAAFAPVIAEEEAAPAAEEPAEVEAAPEEAQPKKQRLYLSNWTYNAALILGELENIVLNEGGAIVSTWQQDKEKRFLITNRSLTQRIEETRERIERIEAYKRSAPEGLKKELLELEAIKNDPIESRNGNYLYLQFSINNVFCSINLDDNPFFDFYISKQPIENGCLTDARYSQTDNKTWWKDIFYSFHCTDAERKAAAAAIFRTIKKAPFSKPHRKLTRPEKLHILAKKETEV